uniref:Uncharacterized protein n=1 Tax=uncultured bacterium BLR12 TaxID=506514 RepID=C0INE0_9BACT|nr:hypothetical protein AKSOIL_0211 [uncultured bacterium BLR12]
MQLFLKDRSKHHCDNFFIFPKNRLAGFDLIRKDFSRDISVVI